MRDHLVPSNYLSGNCFEGSPFSRLFSFFLFFFLLLFLLHLFPPWLGICSLQCVAEIFISIPRIFWSSFLRIKVIFSVRHFYRECYRTKLGNLGSLIIMHTQIGIIDKTAKINKLIFYRNNKEERMFFCIGNKYYIIQISDMTTALNHRRFIET